MQKFITFSPVKFRFSEFQYMLSVKDFVIFFIVANLYILHTMNRKYVRKIINIKMHNYKKATYYMYHALYDIMDYVNEFGVIRANSCTNFKTEGFLVPVIQV